MANLFDIIRKFGEKVAEVQQDNRESQSEKTASGSIFDNIRKKVDNMQNQNSQPTNPSSTNPFDDFRKSVEEAQYENKENPEVETAEPSVFDRMRTEIERMERESKDNPGNTPSFEEEHTNNIPFETKYDHIYEEPKAEAPAPKAERRVGVGSSAMVDGGGGSLALRMDPSMGSAKNASRIPHGANIQVLEYNDANKINLDGKIQGWYKVNFNGQIGWVLESYLK